MNGEVPFTKKLLKYHEWAKANGVLVVPNAAGAGGIPTKLILDADGRVLRVVTGPLTNEAANALVDELLPTR